MLITLFCVHSTWTLGFLIFILVTHLIKIVIAINTGNTQNEFFIASYLSSNIYRLVIDIIAAYSFLPFYVNHGMTRKDYFKGAALASLGLSFTIAILSGVFTFLEYKIVEITNLPLVLEGSSANTFGDGTDNIVIANILEMVVTSPVVDFSSNWLLSLLAFSLNIFTYYLIGWFIGAGYYRYGWFIGFAFIALSIVFMVVGDLLWGSGLGEPFSNWLSFESLSLPLYASIAGTIVLIGFILWFIRLLTRRITIKI